MGLASQTLPITVSLFLLASTHSSSNLITSGHVQSAALRHVHRVRRSVLSNVPRIKSKFASLVRQAPSQKLRRRSMRQMCREFNKFDHHDTQNVIRRRRIFESATVLAVGIQAGQAKAGLKEPPPITTTSSPEAIALARDLAKLDTVFYGAHWCSHCMNQKKVLGKEAFSLIRYVECAEDGVNSQRGLCKRKEIQGYPTWEIAGEQYPGEFALVDLRALVDDILDEKAQRETASQVAAPPKWEVNLLYDSECPVCHAEAEFLRSHDPKGKILFTDISSPDYDPNDSTNGGVSYEDAMERIHAVSSDGEIYQGVEVFRRTYNAIGLGWLFALSKAPLIGDFADGLYDTWAANRLRLTGRSDLADQIKRRREMKKTQCTEDPNKIDGGDSRKCPSLT